MSIKKRLLVAICGVTLCVGAANAQVIVRMGPPPPVVVNVRDGLCMRVGCGSPDITAGTADGISGLPDAGRPHLGPALSGCPADGFRAVGAGSTSTDIGAKAWGRAVEKLS
jgi:hypothetical protein